MKIFITLLFTLFCTSATLYGQSYNDWIERYQSQVKNDSLEAAEQSLIAALKLESAGKQTGYAYSNLGTLQRRMGKNEQALDSYSKALIILPHSLTVLMNRASLYSDMNIFDKALRDYSEIILIDPDYEDAYYLRGLIRIETGDTLAAKQDFDLLYKKNKNSALARVGTATLYNASGRYREAAELYTEVIRFNPQKASFYLNRSEAYLLDQKPGKALKDINSAIEIDDKNAVYYYMRGKIKMAMFEKESAKNDFKAAVDLGLNPRLVDEQLKK